MDPMANIPIGTKGEEKLLVTSDVAIDFLGVDPAKDGKFDSDLRCELDDGWLS